MKGFDIAKMQNAFDQEKKALEGRHKANFEAMKTCPNCQETDTKFIPCKVHLGELKAVGEAMGDLQMQTQLKVQMHPIEMKKAMEEQMKIMAQQLKKGNKPDKCTDKNCATCH